jgi:GT2 family glycosyltransferase
MVSLLDADLIVCTRNRPTELARVLASIARQTTLPASALVVDSSDTDSSEQLVAACGASWPVGSKLEYLRSGPGLPHQRNLGIDATKRPIVCFLDDDVVLEPDYFLAIGAVFAADDRREIGGVGATIIDQPARARLWKLDAVLGLDSAREGAVLSSGRNVRVYRVPDAPLEVDWLAGLATAYRREVFDSHRPNERLIVEGEDVEFSYRVRQEWRLVVSPHARVFHAESGQNRPDRVEVAARELWVRHLRCAQRVGRLGPAGFWRGAVLQLLRATITGAVSAEQRAIARGTLRGMTRIVRKRGVG